jgi:MFS family permease
VTIQHLRRATAAYVLAITAHTTFIFYFAPVALRAGGLYSHDLWVFAASAFTTMLAVVPAGRLSDRQPRRRVLRVGLGLIGASYLILVLAPAQLTSILAAAICSGLGLGFTVIPFNSYVADMLSGDKMAGGYGKSSAVSVLASALGPIVAASVFSLSQAPVIGLRVNAALFATAPLLGILLTLDLPSVRTEDSAPPINPNLPQTSAVGPLAILYVLMGVGTGMSAPYYAVYFLDHLYVTNALWGVLMAIGTAAGAVGFWVTGNLNRRFRTRTLVFSGMGMHLAACAVFAFPVGLVILSAAYALRSLLSNAVMPLTNTIIMSRCAAGVRGQTMGWANLAWNGGWGSGALIGSRLLHEWGGHVFPAGAALGLVGAILGFTVLERRVLRPPALAQQTAPTSP